MDRALAPEVRRQDRRRRVLQIAMPVLVLALVVVWLPGWMRPSVNRARIRTALVTTGPVEAVIMASGTVTPEVERVLSSPLDARVLRILQRPGAHLKRGDPVVELDISESVLALDKVVKDLKIKDNQQAQTRLTLERSLVDLDGRLELKALELESAEARLEGEAQLFKEGLLSRDALRRSELGVKQAHIELAQLRDQRKNAERTTTMQLEGLVARARLARQGSRAGAPSPRSLDDQVGSRRRADLGAVAGGRARPPGRRHRAHRRPHLVPRRRHRLGRPRRPAAHRHVRRGPRERPGSARARSPTSSRRSRTACIRFTVALAEPSHAGLRPSLRVDVLVITDRKPRALRVERGPFADNAARQAFVVRGDRAVRVPLELGLSGVDDVEVLSGVAEGDEVIISDMKDYLHLSAVKIR